MPRLSPTRLSGARATSGPARLSIAYAAPARATQVMRGTFKAEAPNDKVNDFTGQLCLDGQSPVLVSRINCMLRGAQLRSTSWIYGLVISCGRETKANFGSKDAVVKFPTTLKMLNKDIQARAFLSRAALHCRRERERER